MMWKVRILILEQAAQAMDDWDLSLLKIKKYI